MLRQDSLVNIGHKAARVAEGVLVLHPVLDELVVAGVLLARAKVGRREDLGFLRTAEGLVRQAACCLPADEPPGCLQVSPRRRIAAIEPAGPSHGRYASSSADSSLLRTGL